MRVNKVPQLQRLKLKQRSRAESCVHLGFESSQNFPLQHPTYKAAADTKYPQK